MAPEDIAREFHRSYERMAPEFNYKTREESAVPWEQVPIAQRRLMISVVAALMSRGVIHAGS